MKEKETYIMTVFDLVILGVFSIASILLGFIGIRQTTIIENLEDENEELEKNLEEVTKKLAENEYDKNWKKNL